MAPMTKPFLLDCRRHFIGHVVRAVVGQGLEIGPDQGFLRRWEVERGSIGRSSERMISRYPVLTANESASGFGSVSSTSSRALSKLGDRGLRISRPGRDPFLQPTAGEDDDVGTMSLIQGPPLTDVSCHTKDCAITAPGVRHVATFLPLATVQRGQHTQADISHVGRRTGGRSVGLFGPLLKQFDLVISFARRSAHRVHWIVKCQTHGFGVTSLSRSSGRDGWFPETLPEQRMGMP